MKNEYWINIKHVDNRLVIYFNGETIWDSGLLHDDPSMNVFVEISALLEKNAEHISELIFEGFNDTYQASDTEEALNPWHFEYRLIKRVVDTNGAVVEELDMIKPYNEKHLSNPNNKAINNRYKIQQKQNEFKVVSNALSQNFYN